MTSHPEIVARYESFASDQAHGSSPSLEAWALTVAGDARLQAVIATLPPAKQQPNLVFAAARWHGATPGDADALHRALLDDFDPVRATIMTRSTQTNEAARGAVIALGLSALPGPIALIEIGASAGLCLAFDRYSYRIPGLTLDPVDGPSPVTIDIDVTGQWPARARTMPAIGRRAGVDLNPLDPGDADTIAWLTTLIWPEHQARRDRLRSAAQCAAALHLDIRRADLRSALPQLLDTLPAHLTPVVMHSATLAYLDEAARAHVGATIRSGGAHRLSFEGRGVVPGLDVQTIGTTPDTLFVAALDGTPYALGNGHGDRLRLV